MPLSIQRTKRAALAAAAALLAGALGLPTSALAQADYPNQPITFIVPFAPGGSTDAMARSLAQAMSKQLGQTIVIENKPGAGGTQGVVDMLRTKPDGYRLTLVPSSVFRLPYIQKVPYDPNKDLSYIATFTAYDFIIGVPTDSPIKSMADVIEQARKQPGSINYGTPGQYTANQVVMAKLGKAVGADFIHVPFKGDADATNALLGGHLKVLVSTNGILNFINSGKIRALAVVAESRLPAFANAPTLKELGYDLTVTSPLGLAGPKGLPAAVVEKLDNAVKAALQDPQMQRTMQNFAMRADYRDHSAYTDWAHQTYAAEKTLVQGLNLKD